MQKKEFTSFDAAAVTRELNQMILGSRVNNIYQVGHKTFLLKLHKPNHPSFQLVMEAGKRLHLTNYALEKPLRPTAFCMALRAYLRNDSLTSLEQHEFERLVTASFRTNTGALHVALEVFGEGNFILIGKDNKILQALTYKRMRDRNILRGETFQFPPSAGKNPLKTDFEQFQKGSRSFGKVEVVRALARFSNIGGQYSEEILLRTAIEKTRSCDSLSISEMRAIHSCLQDLLLQVTTGTLEPSIVVSEDGNLVDATPIKLKQHEKAGFQSESRASFNEALDEFYSRISIIEETTAGIEAENLSNEAERFKRIVNEQERLLAEGKAKSELEKQMGDAVYTHLNELQALLDTFLTNKKKGKDLKSVTSQLRAQKQRNEMPGALFESVDDRGLIVTVNIDGLSFGMNTDKTPFQNANEFYEHSKQFKQKMEGARKALADSLKLLSGIESKMRDAEALKLGKPNKALEQLATRKIKPKKWFEKFRWFVSSDGFLVVAGKDAVTNEILVKKYAGHDDVVFHADVMGAPFVLVKTETREPSEQCLSEAAEFAASFSRAWREGFGSVDVYSVSPEQLSKGGPSGESVGHGAFIVYGRRNWMRGVTLQEAIGIVANGDHELQFVGGPPSAVKAKTETYVILTPGDLPIKDLFKLILKALAIKASKDLRRRILGASVEDFREYIPYGKGRILKE